MPQNPWLEISPEDYVGHMASPGVAQYQMINELFKYSLATHQPKTLFVPGCTIGNGFEHINWSSVNNVTALDINPNYLNILKQKFGSNPQLRVVNTDLLSFEAPAYKFDMIYAALLFEYVNTKAALKKLKELLHKNSVMIAILQKPSSAQGKVSKSKYTSLEKLNSIMNLVDINEFKTHLKSCDLIIHKINQQTLESGKAFYIAEIKQETINNF